MIADNTTTALAKIEPLTRGTGQEVGANNEANGNPRITRKPRGSAGGVKCQPASKAVGKPKAPEALLKGKCCMEDMEAFADNGGMLRGAADALVDLGEAMLFFNDYQESEAARAKGVLQDVAKLLVDAADILERHIPTKALEKSEEERGMYSMVHVNGDQICLLMSHAAFDIGRLGWKNGQAYMDGTSFCSISNFLYKSLAATRDVLFTSYDAVANPRIAAGIIQLKGTQR